MTTPADPAAEPIAAEPVAAEPVATEATSGAPVVAVAAVPRHRRPPKPPSRPERWFMGITAVMTWVVLGVAFSLQPSEQGFGTHEQLGLQPCGFVLMSEKYMDYKIPCPSCGMTTSWSFASKGRFLSSIVTQPMGFFLFCCAVVWAVWGLACALFGVRFLGWIDRLPATPSALTVIGLGIAAWVYKIIMMN